MSISLYPFEIIDNLEQTDALTWRLLGFKEKGGNVMRMTHSFAPWLMQHADDIYFDV